MMSQLVPMSSEQQARRPLIVESNWGKSMALLHCYGAASFGNARVNILTESMVSFRSRGDIFGSMFLAVCTHLWGQVEEEIEGINMSIQDTPNGPSQGRVTTSHRR